MVATASTRVTQAEILAAATAAASASMRVTAADILVALHGLTPAERLAWLSGLVTTKSTPTLRVTNAAVLVAVLGGTQNPKLWAWTCTLDGHDFYVLRLGMMGTLVYDAYSEEWMDWDAFGQIYWPVNVGFNWVDGQGIIGDDGLFGSNILVGHESSPLLYFLDPNLPYDENPESLDAQAVFFERVLQGQVIQTGREVQPCYAVWLTTDMGAPAYVGAGVKLEISDDAGATYDDMGTVTVTPGENLPELSWYSLGQIAAPGRLFRITDDGAVARIDSMEMNDPDDNVKK